MISANLRIRVIHDYYIEEPYLIFLAISSLMVGKISCCAIQLT